MSCFYLLLYSYLFMFWDVGDMISQNLVVRFSIFGTPCHCRVKAGLCSAFKPVFLFGKYFKRNKVEMRKGKNVKLIKGGSTSEISRQNLQIYCLLVGCDRSSWWICWTWWQHIYTSKIGCFRVQPISFASTTQYDACSSCSVPADWYRYQKSGTGTRA